MRKGDVLGRKGITVNLSQLYYFRKLSELHHFLLFRHIGSSFRKYFFSQ